MPDVNQRMAEVKRNPEVLGAAPFVASQALLARGEDMKGVMVRGIVPALEPQVTDLTNSALGAQGEALARLVPGDFGIVLGVELARNMGVRQGDKVTLVSPSGQVTPAGVVPRLSSR